MLAIGRLISKPPQVFAGQVPDIFQTEGEEIIQSNGCIIIFSIIPEEELLSPVD